MNKRKIDLNSFIPKRFLTWRSYPTLILLFFFGVLIISGSFYFLYEFKVDQWTSLEAKKTSLDKYLEENKTHWERLAMPSLPDSIEAKSLAQKVPFDRHVPGFLINLSTISDIVGIELTKLEIEEIKPEKKDYVTLFLKELGTLAKDMKDGEGQERAEKKTPSSGNLLDLSGIQQRERVFIMDPEKFLQGYLQQDEQSKMKSETSESATEIPPELLDYIPFGIVHFHLEFQGSYRQLTDFLGLLQSSDRLVHIEKWVHQYDQEGEDTKKLLQKTAKVDFKIFYYKEKLEGIDDIKPLDPIERSEGQAKIYVLPKAMLEKETSIGKASSEDILIQQKVKGLLQELPQEPETKD